MRADSGRTRRPRRASAVSSSPPSRPGTTRPPWTPRSRLARALATTVEELFAAERRDVVAALGGSPAATARRCASDASAISSSPPSWPTTASPAPAGPSPTASFKRGKLRLFPAPRPPAARGRRLRPGARGRRSDARRTRARAACWRSPRRPGPRWRARARRACTPRSSTDPRGRLPEAARAGDALAPRALAGRARRTARAVARPVARGAAPRQGPIAQRDAAAASQQAFDARGSKRGSQTPPARAARHRAHRRRARSPPRSDGAAVTTEAAARAFDLRFLALEDHTVEIWLARALARSPGCRRPRQPPRQRRVHRARRPVRRLRPRRVRRPGDGPPAPRDRSAPVGASEA